MFGRRKSAEDLAERTRELAWTLRKEPAITKADKSLLEELFEEYKKHAEETPKELAAAKMLVKNIITASRNALHGDVKDAQLQSEASKDLRRKPVTAEIDPLVLLDPEAVLNQALAPWVVANHLLHEYNRKIARFPEFLRQRKREDAEKHISELREALEEFMNKHALPQTLIATGYVRDVDMTGETPAEYVQKTAPRKIKAMHDSFGILATATLALHGNEEAKSAINRYFEELAVRAELAKRGEIPTVDDINRLLVAREIVESYGKQLGIDERIRKKIQEAVSIIDAM